MAFSSVKVMSTSQIVVAAYDLGLDTTKIVYRRHGDEVWRALDCGGGEMCTYYDVVCCDRKNTLFALGAGPSVDSWDFNDTIPTKTTIIQGSCPRTLALAHHRFPTDLFDSHAWLGSTPLGQIFLVVLYVAETSLGTVDQILGFRLDLDLREWIDVEWCNFPALFLGLNQSVLVPAFDDEVVYYSNDYWESFDGFSYGVVYKPRETMIEEEGEEKKHVVLECGEKIDRIN